MATRIGGTEKETPARVPVPHDQHHRFLAAIIQSAEDAIFAKTLDGRILSWNAGAERMYGYAPEEIVGSEVTRLAPRDRHPEIAQLLARIRRGERVEHHETIRVRRSGEQFPVSLAISPVRDEGGTIIGASTIARDITEQQRLIEAVSFQNSLLVAQAESLIDGILVVDPTGRVTFRNRRYTEMWGLPGDADDLETQDDLLARVLPDVVDSDAFVARVQHLRTHPLEASRDTIRLSDGRVFDRYSAPVLGAEKRYYGRVWYFRDVTSEDIRMAQLRAVIAAVDDAAFVVGPNRDVILRNPAAERLLPDVASEADLLAALGPVQPSDAGAEPAPGDAHAPEHVLVVDGESRHMRLSRHPIDIAVDAPTAGREGSVILLKDVTELRDIQASREAFIGVLSHELRTPITTIFGAAKMLQRFRATGQRKELLIDIEAESDRLYRLVEDLLVLTRIERESLSVADEPVLVGPIVQRVVAAERGRVPDVQFEIDLPPALPIVRGDDTYLEQILRNLVGNAVKYGPRDGAVRIIAGRSPGGVAVRVLDDGPGIKPRDADRVFDLLYRAPATAAQASGSGIGLFVSRRLAEAMGGRIWARPREGRGAEFGLELPLYETAAPGSEAGLAMEPPATR